MGIKSKKDVVPSFVSISPLGKAKILGQDSTVRYLLGSLMLVISPCYTRVNLFKRRISVYLRYAVDLKSVWISVSEVNESWLEIKLLSTSKSGSLNVALFKVIFLHHFLDCLQVGVANAEYLWLP